MKEFDMRLFLKNLVIISLLFWLSGCSALNLTPQETVYIQSIRDTETAALKKSGNKRYDFPLERQLWMYSPERLAAQAVKDKNYRLASLAMGLRSTDKDAKIVGINCSQPVEVEPIVFGCIPPPAVFFKLLIRYNYAVFKNPAFPYKNVCVLDKATRDEIEMNDKNTSEGYKKFEDEFNSDVEKSIKESRRYN